MVGGKVDAKLSAAVAYKLMSWCCDAAADAAAFPLPPADLGNLVICGSVCACATGWGKVEESA